MEWYDDSLEGDLLFQAGAQSMNVNARSYRWSTLGSKKCEMGVDETVMHVMLKCTRYDRDRGEMMRVIDREVESALEQVDEETVRTDGSWMILLLGLSGNETYCMMEAVKIFLEKVWYVRGRR